MCYSSISGRDSPRYLKMQRQQQRYGGQDLQKVKRKLRITLFPACIMHMFTPMQVRRMQAYNGRFVKAWNKQYVSLCVFTCEYVWNAISGWHSPNQPTPPSGQAEEGCPGPFLQQEESHYDSAFTPSEASANLWAGGGVNQDCCNSHTLRLKMCLLDFKWVWLSRLELWRGVYLVCP